MEVSHPGADGVTGNDGNAKAASWLYVMDCSRQEDLSMQEGRGGIYEGKGVIRRQCLGFKGKSSVNLDCSSPKGGVWQLAGEIHTCPQAQLAAHPKDTSNHTHKAQAALTSSSYLLTQEACVRVGEMLC